jgi:putative DNA primase/helicase
VIDDWHEEGGTKFRPGVWHFGIKAGRGDAPPTLTKQWVCSPLHLDAVTTDAHGGNYGRLLRIKSTLGKWSTWAMPMNLLRGDCSDLRGELLGMGVQIDPFNRTMLAVYLQDREPKRRVQCALQTGWASTAFKAFVLPDSTIGPLAAGVAYQSGERGAEEYTTAGTLAGWQSGVAALAVGNPLLVLALSASFARPVLARCNAESGGVHLIGDSSTGKTTAIEAACSVWGGPNFKRSWRTTSNGLEGAATLFNDSLLALDEISECDPRQVGEVVYMLGNGRGKQRAGRTGTARPVMRWRSSVLSTGERSIATTMTEGGHRVKAGQTVRLLDVPAQRTYGAWDNLHQFDTGTAFSDALKIQAATHYGHAGRAFLEKLTRDHEDSFSDALDAIKAMPAYQAPGGEGQAKRAAGRFAVLALAGELATTYGVTG